MTEEIHMSESEQIEMIHAMIDNAGVPRRLGPRELSLVARVARLVNPWQPIDTAPKDGTSVILLRRPESGHEKSRVGIDHYVRRDECWWRTRPAMTPTHWMPIPEVTR